MKVVTDGIGNLVLDELKKAIDVRLAVAYFSPTPEVLTALCAAPSLKLVISEEFTINNPYKIEKLPATATVRSVPSSADNGKLHAKVLIVERPNGSKWALVGSANMTRDALFNNQEACIALESREDSDEPAVRELGSWFDSLIQTARIPDLELAKKIYDSREGYRLELRSEETKASDATADYWVLKTTSGSDGMQHWDEFQAQKIVAIGWEDIAVDPSKVTDEVLKSALLENEPNEDANIAADLIRKFISLKVGDKVFICRGFTAVQRKDVYVYGIARITGPFRVDPHDGRKWRFKHDAVIKEVERFFPRDEIAKALGKGALRRTLHKIDQAGFESASTLLRDAGIHVSV